MQNVVEKLVPYHFLKKSEFSISQDQQSKFYTACFYLMSKSRTTKWIETNVLITCFYFIENFFEKEKEV